MLYSGVDNFMSENETLESIKGSSMLPRDVVDELERADRQRLELAGIGCFSQVFKNPIPAL
jgi:hypothetical protein